MYMRLMKGDYVRLWLDVMWFLFQSNKQLLSISGMISYVLTDGVITQIISQENIIIYTSQTWLQKRKYNLT